jgi:hypothetical protein
LNPQSKCFDTKQCYNPLICQDVGLGDSATDKTCSLHYQERLQGEYCIMAYDQCHDGVNCVNQMCL